MPLTQEQKKQFKSIGHHLKPVLIVADNGLTEGVLAELERALNDHELIKVQLRVAEREDRLARRVKLRVDVGHPEDAVDPDRHHDDAEEDSFSAEAK